MNTTRTARVYIFLLVLVKSRVGMPPSSKHAKPSAPPARPATKASHTAHQKPVHKPPTQAHTVRSYTRPSTPAPPPPPPKPVMIKQPPVAKQPPVSKQPPRPNPPNVNIGGGGGPMASMQPNSFNIPQNNPPPSLMAPMLGSASQPCFSMQGRPPPPSLNRGSGMGMRCL